MEVRLGFWLMGLLALEACGGDVLVGIKPDAGDDDITEMPPGAVGDGGVGPIQDARVTSSMDGSAGQPGNGASKADASGGGKSDGATPPDATTPSGNDAGQPAGRDFSTDKSKFTGGASRCPGDVLLCEDFESLAAGASPGAPWSFPYGYMPTADTAQAARGSKSMHFTVGAGTPGHMRETKTFPIANNTIYGRMFVRIPQLVTGAPSSNVAHYTFVGASGASGVDNDVQVRLDGMWLSGNMTNHFGIGSDGSHTNASGQDDDDWHIDGTESQSVIRANDWICLEWMFKGDTNETRVWIDAVEQSSLHTTSTNYYQGGEYMSRPFQQPTYDKLDIGWWVYQSDTTPTPYSIWIDEIIVDTQRIGCVL